MANITTSAGLKNLHRPIYLAGDLYIAQGIILPLVVFANIIALIIKN